MTTMNHGCRHNSSAQKSTSINLMKTRTSSITSKESNLLDIVSVKYGKIENRKGRNDNTNLTYRLDVVDTRANHFPPTSIPYIV